MSFRILATLIAPLACLAADVSERVTWTQCLHEAGAANEDLLAARQSLEQARFDTLAAKAAFRPTLDVGAGAAYSGADGAGVDRTSDSWSTDLSTSYVLADGGARSARFRSALLREDRAKQSERRERARVGYELTSAYTRLEFAREELDLLRQIADRRQQNGELVQLRYEGGKENLGATLRSKAILDGARQDLSAASRTLRSLQRTLAVLVGRPSDQELVTDGVLATSSIPTTVNLESLAHDTPDVRLADIDRQLADLEVQLAKSPYAPEWSLGFSAGTSGDDPAMDTTSWRAGLRVSYGIYNGGRDRANLQSSEAAAEVSAHRYTSVRRDALLELENRWNAAVDAKELTAVQESFCAAAEVRAEIARGQYASGLIGFQEWDQIEEEVIRARKSTLNARRDAILAAANWERALGLSPIGEP